MKTELSLNLFDIVTFLGVFQGLFISLFFLKHYRNSGYRANLYQGLLILAFSAGISEQFLNNTGLIVKVLKLTNFSEPLNLVFGPLFYLHIRYSVSSFRKGNDWVHFLPFIIYFAYSAFYYMQPDEVKYNSYIFSYHPEWPGLDTKEIFNQDPIGIREYINEITGLHYSIYLLAAFMSIREGGSILKIGKIINHDRVKIRNSVIHMTFLVCMFIFVKVYFGRDLGDYFLSAYISILIFITSYRVISTSQFFSQTESFLDLHLLKYSKSSLSADRKVELEEKIKYEMREGKFYKDSSASLPQLAKRVQAEPHHVSQVINEKMNTTFFELLAIYRVEEAKKIFSEEKSRNLTIEVIAEMVGYNSKTAFLNAFKRNTGMTPSQYRDSL